MTTEMHALLEQTSWIHALARRLVADPHLADDLAQTTWVDALERPPDGSQPLRGWLATVMRNNLSRLRRGERNRSAREQGASRAELVPGAHDVLERAETHRNVVLAVLALDEPYRSTLLMRFFEQLSYHEIARRTGLTRAAVNSRITRGLELLRRRLESAYGDDRRALALALIPLAKLPTGLATTLFGVKLMNVLIGTTAATLLATAVTVGLNREARTARPLATPAAAATEPSREPPEELRAPVQFARAPLAAQPGPVEPALEQEKRAKHSKEAEENVWKTEIRHLQALPASVESIGVNASSGDIEVLASPSGQLEVTARVKARTDIVSSDQLTQIFEDHVEIVEEEGELRIEDKHRGSRGWTVSFVVGVPGNLPIGANSGSGDIVLRHGRGRVAANTGSGDVTIALPAERVEVIEANTGSGDVVLEVLSIEKKLGANTGSGSVTALVLDGTSPGKAGFNSGSGDVLLIVPAGVVGSFDLETNGDDLVVPPALGLVVKEERGGRRQATGSIGNGGGSYVLRSGSGQLKVEIGSTLPAEER